MTDYERHLDLDRAVASECYVRNGAKFTRTCFSQRTGSRTCVSD
ncbi:MAG: glycoside hydrolase N-terminal domain-containing protein [Ruminococcus sp.]